MTDAKLAAPSDAELPATIEAAGWTQGTLFRASGIDVRNAGSIMSTVGETESAGQPRQLPNVEYFIVASQTCDIVARLADEPFIEALACVTEPDASRRANFSKSARRFEVDVGTGLMALAAHRVVIDKRALLELSPQPWPSTLQRLIQFRTWLGRRFTRPAIDDAIVRGFVTPFEDVLRRVRKQRPEAFLAFSNAVGEVRIRLPSTDDPPYDLHMLLLLSDDVDHEGDEAIDMVVAQLRSGLTGTNVTLLDPVLRQTWARTSVQVYFETVPIFLEHLTYRGDEVTGAEPTPSA